MTNNTHHQVSSIVIYCLENQLYSLSLLGTIILAVEYLRCLWRLGGVIGAATLTPIPGDALPFQVHKDDHYLHIINMICIKSY